MYGLFDISTVHKDPDEGQNLHIYKTSRGKVQKQLEHKKFDNHEGYERVYIVE